MPLQKKLRSRCPLFAFFHSWRLSFLASEVKAQGRVRQMRVIVLRPWSNQRALVVVVVLISNIPIEPAMQPDRETRLRRLKTHRIRRDEETGIACRIRHARSLTVVVVYPVTDEQRRARSHLRHRVDVEEVVPHVVKT